MSLLLCIWFALKIFFGIIILLGTLSAFMFSLGYSFVENDSPFKPWKMIVFPLTIFLLVVMWIYIIFNVDIEKYMTPSTQVPAAQVVLENK